jgi:hypothetical protein
VNVEFSAETPILRCKFRILEIVPRVKIVTDDGAVERIGTFTCRQGVCACA